MAARQVVLCSPLCFLIKKFGKCNLKVLKSSVVDFYDVDAISQAKRQLLDDVNSLKLTEKPPHVPSRRDGDNRLAREVDDIVTVLTFLDEKLEVNNLPCYAADDPDSLPSLRMYDGDLKLLTG